MKSEKQRRTPRIRGNKKALQRKYSQRSLVRRDIETGLSEGRLPVNIVEDLVVRKGYDRALVEDIMEIICSSSVVTDHGLRNVLMGGTIFAAGLFITVITTNSGSQSLIMYGAIFWGVVQTIQGIIQLSSRKKKND